MSFCINHNCKERKNLEDAKECAKCRTSLLICGGRYRLKEMIGNTSADRNWEVFIGEDTRDVTTKVIIKTLRTINNTTRRLFEIEERILLQITDSGIPQVIKNIDTLNLKIDEDEDERLEIPYFIMQYIDGQDLRKWVKENNKIENEAIAWQWLKEIIDILDRLHNLDYFHRDIKPDNIMLRAIDKKIVLIDFGVGKNSRSSIQGVNTEVGTPGFRAPEQTTGGGDHRSDFYSLGKTFFKLTTGVHPQNRGLGNNWELETNFKDSAIIKFIEWMAKENADERPQNTIDILYAIDKLKVRMDGVYCSHEDANILINNIKDRKLEDEIMRWHLQEKERKIQYVNILNEQLKSQINLQESQLKDSNYQTKLDNLDGLNTGTGWKINDPKNKSCLPNLPTALAIVISNVIISVFTTATLTSRISPLCQNFSFFLCPSDTIQMENEKQIAINFFNGGEYDRAHKIFHELIEESKRKYIPVDPTLLIYMNNSKVRYLHGLPKYQNKLIRTVNVIAPKTTERGKLIIAGVALNQNTIMNGEIKLGKYEINSKLDADSPSHSFYFYVEVTDDDNSTEKVKMVAQDIPTSTDAVIGSYTSEVTCEAVRILSKRNIPIINSTSELVNLRGICNDNNKVFHRIPTPTNDEAETLIKKIKTLGDKKLQIIVLHKNGKKESFSQDIFNQVKRQLKQLENSDKKKFQVLPFIDLSDSPQKTIQDLKKITQPTVIILLPDGESDKSNALGNAIEIIREVKGNKDIRLILGSNPLMSQKTLKIEGLSKKLLVAGDWSESPSCSNPAFVAMAKENLGLGYVDRTIATSYEASQALTKLFQDKIDQKQINAKLNTGFTVLSEVYKNVHIQFENGDRTGKDESLDKGDCEM
jgi:eukaryotic-like serine/threonine-protein kinase